MRLKQYLKEDYLDTVKCHSEIYDVYKNPTSKELKLLMDWTKRGFRFVIDADTKNFYVTSVELTHSDLFDRSKEIKNDIKGFTYGTSYFRHGKGLDRILTGSTEKPNFNKIYSDTMMWDISSSINEPNYQQCYNQLNKLKSKDFSFMSKWIKPSLIEELIDDCIKHLEDVMTGDADPDDD